MYNLNGNQNYNEYALNIYEQNYKYIFSKCYMASVFGPSNRLYPFSL